MSEVDEVKDNLAQPYEHVDFKGENKELQQQVTDDLQIEADPKEAIIETKPLQQVNNDDLPVGKSNFKLDEYPPEGAPPIKKAVATKSKTVKKQPLANIDDLPIKPAEQLDELPVGQGKKFEISEFPEGHQEEQGSSELPPLQARLKSKAWKMRQSAFEEIAEMFNQGQGLDEYFEEWPKIINDNNPGSQEKALVAFQIFMAKSNKKQIEQRLDGKECVRILIDKCIAPGKTNIKKISMELLFDIFERKDKVEMFEVLNEMLKNKVQKVQCAAIQSIVELLTAFGPKRLDFLKPFFPEIEKLAQSTTASVKQECMTLYKEAFKWLGEQVLAPFVKNLKKLQLDELEKFQKEYEQVPLVPTRGGGDAVQVVAGGNNLDAYDVVDAVDIFNKYNEKWCDKVLAQTKWNEKCVLLEQLIKECQCPKIAPGNYSPMISMIKKLLQEQNANVNMSAIKVCGLLCKGLRKNFTQSARLLFPLLVPKLRDKKTLMIDETKQALELFHYSINVEEVVEDFKEALVDKNPQMKCLIMQLLHKLISIKGVQNKQKFTDTMKQLLPLIKKQIEDSVPEVREATVQCLGNLKPLLSEQLITSFYSDLGNKLGKINEIAQAIEDAKKQAAQKDIKETKKQEPEKQNTQKPQQQQQQQQQTQQLQQSQVQASEAKKPPLAKQQKVQIEEEAEPTLEVLENQLRDNGVDESFFELINGNAKQKAEGLKNVESYFDAIFHSFDVVLYYLKNKLKDWKEVNLSINKELFAMIIYARDLDPRPFTKKSFPPLCKLLIEKITESKFKDDIFAIVKASCESVSPKFVVAYFIQQTAVQVKDDKKKELPPKTLSEIIQLIVKIIELVTLKYLPFKDMLDFGKEQIQQTNPAVKASTVDLFKTMYKFLGQELVPHLQDIPPQVLKTLTSEFEKVNVVAQQESQLTFQGEAASEIISLPQVNPMDQLPRADISGPVQNILKKLSDIQWNKRKEAVEELDKLLTQNGNRVQMNGLGELISLLKARLADNNKGVIRPVVQIVGRLAEACGKDFKKLGKELVVPLISILSDKQVLVRQDVVTAMDKFCIALGSDQIVSQFVPFLSYESTELKQELLQFMVRYPEGFVKSDIKQFITPLLNNLCDRVKETRQYAEQLIEKAIEEIGVQPFEIATKDMKPAVVQQIKAFLSKHGLEVDETSKRTGRTPKNKLGTTLPERNMKRTQTTKDLTQELNTSQEFRTRQERTPKKSIHQKSHKTLPQETPSKPSFEHGIVASNSSKELKILRLQENIQIWQLEQFNQDLSELTMYIKEDVYQQMMNFNYKDNIKGIKQVSQAFTTSILEMSDLLLKYILFKLYGGGNTTLLDSIQQFCEAVLRTLCKQKYMLTEIEQIIMTLILRELCYSGRDCSFEMLSSLEQLMKGDMLLLRILLLYKTNHASIHIHLANQGTQIESQLSKLVVYFCKYFNQESIQELASLQINNREILLELQNLFGDSLLKRFGLIPTQQLAQPQINTQSQIIQQTKDPKSVYFQQLLDSLLSQSTSQKIESLMQINDLLTQNHDLIIENAEAMCRCFHTLLQSTFTNRDAYPAQFTQFFLKALSQLYQLKPYVKAVPYDSLCAFTEDLMSRLLAEDEIKNTYEQGDNTVKSLNATTLRVLENTPQDIIFSILFDIMTKHRRRSQQGKMIGLLTKCITRIVAKIDAKQIKIDLLLLKFHNYLTEFGNNPNFSIDESGVKIIKVVLQQIVLLKGEAMWELYSIVEHSKTPDQYLNKWIQAFLANMSQQPIVNNYMANESQMMPQSQVIVSRDEQDLLEIQEMLKQPQLLEQGIQKLVEKIRRNPCKQSYYLELFWQKYVQDKQIQLLIQQQLNTPLTVPQLQSLDQRQVMRGTMRQNNELPQTAQQQNLKTPEYLMSKLNDMKNKIQTLVGPQNPQNPLQQVGTPQAKQLNKY